MLVENHQPNSRSIGNIFLIPGVNKLDKKNWDKQVKAGYKKAVDGLIQDGILSIRDESKVTVSLVAKTYDVTILEEWLTNAKGPLKGAIKKQIDLMTTEEKTEKD